MIKFFKAKTVRGVIHNQPASLQISVHNSTAHEFEPTFYEVFA